MAQARQAIAVPCTIEVAPFRRNLSKNRPHLLPQWEQTTEKHSSETRSGARSAVSSHRPEAEACLVWWGLSQT